MRILAAETYDRAAIESLIQDTSTDVADLIELGTLHVLVLDGEIVACGGWWEAARPVAARRPRLASNASTSILVLRAKVLHLGCLPLSRQRSRLGT